MNDLPPIPDPHTPPTENKPIWLVDLLLVGLFYVACVTILYLLMSAISLAGTATIMAEQLGIFCATTFGQMRFLSRIAKTKEEKNLVVALPLKMTLALSATLAILCFIQGLVFQSRWKWMTLPREPISNSHYFVLLFYTAFAFLWPFYLTQILPNMKRRKQQVHK